MTDSLTLPVGLSFPKTALEVSIEFDEYLKTSGQSDYKPIPTGFDELDGLLGGGLHPESLTVVGGPPGVGKTVFILQTARNVAASGTASACVVCFEHSEVYFYHRLLCLESVCGGSESAGVTLDDLRRITATRGVDGLQAAVEILPQAAWQRLVDYWERLYLVKGHPLKTTLNVLNTYLSHLRGGSRPVVLFVDYLQKVPVSSIGNELTPEKQMGLVTEGLKNLAMAHHVPIVAVVASDTEGLKGGRVRFRDTWGGASVQYEPDVALILNPSENSKREEERRSRQQVNVAIEKNRLGPANVDVHLELLGEYFAFKAISRNGFS